MKIVSKKYGQNERPKQRASALLTMAMLLLSVGILAQTHLGQQMASAADVCQNLGVSNATASGVDGNNVPANTLDGNINNRWSAYGVGSWISFDLGSSQTVCFVDIDWYKGQSRMYNLVISVSQDGTSFTEVFNGKSSGTTGLFERYDFADVSARHVKITVNGNNNNNWASISEVQIYGSAGVVIPLPGGGSADTTAPSITAPADVTKEATGSLTVANLGTPTVSDNVDTTPTVTNNAPSAGFPLGTTTVIWTAIDDSGNSATATQSVIIKDTTAPSISAPANTVVTATGALTSVQLGTASASDAVDSTPTVSNNAPLLGFPLGETSVTWSAKDDAGNTATDMQKVTVNPIIIPPPSGGSDGEFSILGVTASSNDGNVPENTMDENLTTRWSAYGMGSWIEVELSKSVSVKNVSIAWYNGANRVSDFVVATSDDGTTFTDVFSGKSSGASTQLEGYDTTDKTAKYVRFTVTGNSQNNWASITEIAVNGAQVYYEPEPEPTPIPTPTPTPTSDTTLPTVAITFPANGATVSGLIVGEATASDNMGVSTVAGFIDANALNVETGAPYQYAIDTTKYANGLHKFKVTATDTSGNKASHEISVNVNNGIVIPPPTPTPTPTPDTTLPNVLINSPSNGQSFSAGTTSVTVSGTASDNVGVTLVEKSINGGPFSPTSGTTSWSFTASGLTNGQSYTATIRAKDAAGNTKSAMVSFSIQLPSLPPPPSGGSESSIIWSSIKWSNGLERTISDHEEPDPYDPYLQIAAGNNRKLYIDGQGHAFLSGERARMYIFGENYNAVMELKFVMDGSLDNLSLKMRSRHNEGGTEENRFGGYGMAFHHDSVDTKRENYHNDHTSISSTNLSKPLVDGQEYIIRYTVKDDGSGNVSLIGEIDYNDGKGFVKVVDVKDNDPLSYMLDKNLYLNGPTISPTPSYAWIRTNGASPQDIKISDVKITNLD